MSRPGPLEALDARIALHVLPMLKDITRRVSALAVLVWCQVLLLLGMIILLGLFVVLR